MVEERTAQADAEIIAAVLDGDTEAFGRLVDRYREHVFRIVGRRVPGSEVEEVAQDVFVRAFTSLAGFEGRSPFEFWLSRIAVLACHDFWRRRYRSKEAPLSSLGEEHREWLRTTLADDSGSSQERTEERLMARDVLTRALAGLSPADRTVIELVHLEERPVAEAAALLGWSAVNVKVRAHRARRKLKAIIERMSRESIRDGRASGG